jgi:hypothetical protein
MKFKNVDGARQLATNLGLVWYISKIN